MTATLQELTEETLAAIEKAQTTGILESTGVWSYDLGPLTHLIPVVTPFREKIPRVKPANGNPYAVWRAIMDVTRSQPSPFPGIDYAANEVIVKEQDFQAKYMPVGLAGLVTQDAYDYATGIADPYAEMTMQVLNQVMIGEDKALVGAQSFPLQQPAALTTTASTSGGSIPAASTYMVAVAPRTGMNYYYGGNGQARASGALTTTGSTSSIAASIPAVRGAVAYDWFFSSNSGTTWFYYTTTTVAACTFTAAIAGNQAIPSPLLLPDVSNAAIPTLNLAADNGSANPAAFDGFLATLTADYTAVGQWTTAGGGTTNPAVFIDGGGSALTLQGGSVAQIETLFAQIWNQVKCSPTAIMMNAVQAQEIANLILGSGSATTFLTTDESGRVNTTAGGRVGQIVNTPAGGVTVPIEVHTSLPPGTIVGRTDRVPFPQAEIANPLEVRTLRDMTQFEYGTGRVAGQQAGGPRKEFEIRSVEAFVNRAPVAMGLLENVA